MSVLEAIVLGLVEGLTEFIPVSSTAHLILATNLLGLSGDAVKTFEIFIQLGAILAVVWVYRERTVRLSACIWKPAERPLAASIVVSFLPAAIAGALAHKTIKAHLFTPAVVGTALIAGGIAILIVERIATQRLPEGVEKISLRTALAIGLAQCLALIPGVSRSGATIMGALALGVPRRTATEYSFFLAIPTMFAATLFDLARNLHVLNAQHVPAFAAGFLTAFVSALILIRAFLRFVQHHQFTSFALYRILLGALVLLLSART